MKLSSVHSRCWIATACTFTAALLLVATTGAQELSEPIYRVAHETPAKPVSASASVTAAKVDEFFDLERRSGEHPLAPCKRLAERALAHIDQNIQDYSCKFAKQERIDGKLQSAQHMQMQIRHEPFSIYLRFIKPKKGQEVLYVDGQNDNRIVALASGWKRNIGKLNLDPNGSMAMDGQKYPITKAGVRNLTRELITIAENDMQYGECEVTNYPDVKVAGRPAVMIEAKHPVPRREFRFHIARIYIDKEYRIPVRFEAYKWPKSEGEQPPLEEVYVYTNFEFNHGYTNEDFSENNPEFFQ